MDKRWFVVPLAVCICGTGYSQFTDSVWITGGQGNPGDLVSVDVWVHYCGSGPGDSIALFDIPLTYDPMVCTVDVITVGPDFANWVDVSRIDNGGTQGLPATAKIAVSAYTLGPPIAASFVEGGSHLAATVGFRTLNTATPGDSTCIDTLIRAFSPPLYLGLAEDEAYSTWVPSFSAGCVRVSAYACGDCNGDGVINFGDALHVKNYYYQTPPGSPAPIGEGDVNVDGKIDFADALYLKNYYYQTPPGSPAPCEPSVTTLSRQKRGER